MFCRKCGADLDDNLSFCTSCGAPVKKSKKINSPVADSSQYHYEEMILDDYSSEKSYIPNIGVKENRSFILYLLLNVVTCGIYSLFFLHGLIKDINIMCEGDGKKTPGLLCFIGFSVLTFGLYGYYWYYCLSDRVDLYAEGNSILLPNDAIKVLLWITFGIYLFGIGFYIGMYKLIKNVNIISSVHNSLM